MSPRIVTLAFRIATLALLHPLLDSAEASKPSIWLLQREVRDREREVARAQCELAKARARLAKAQGKQAVVVAQLGKVVSYYEAELQRVKRLVKQGRICTPSEALEDAEGQASEARAELALAQGKTRTAIGELQKVVVFREKYVKRVQDWLKKKVVREDELWRAREQLKAARRKLEAAQVRAKSSAKIAGRLFKKPA